MAQRRRLAYLNTGRAACLAKLSSTFRLTSTAGGRLTPDGYVQFFIGWRAVDRLGEGKRSALFGAVVDELEFGLV